MMKEKITNQKRKKVNVAPEPKFGLAELAAANKRAIASAGPRYFLNKDPNFPNMSIESFDKAIAGLVGGDGFHALVEDVKQNIEGRWSDFSFHPPSDFRGKLPEPKGVLRALDELAKSAPGRGEEAIAKICQRAERAHKKADALLSQIRKARDKQYRKIGDFPPHDPSHSVISYRDALGRAMHFMPEKDYSFLTGKPVHMRANACGLHQNGILILCGQWGMGKTHSLCDLAKRQEERGLPALLVLAKNLKHIGLGHPPGDALALHTQLADNFDGLLRRLNALGRKAKVRALLLVDGINENNPSGVWQRELGKMIKRVRAFPFVGLVVSYRVPFRCGLPKPDLLETPCMEHAGFREIPLEAQAAFLKYYDVPLPEIPPMAEEFTRPLTLKIICKTFQNLPKSEQRKGFDGIASGQKGMTYILERYIKEQAAAVAKKHRTLSKQKIWSLLDEVMAPYMAKNLMEEIPAALLLEKMRDCFSVNLLKARKILRDMNQEGVVIIQRGIPWEWHEHASGAVPTKQWRWRMLVQMPYQRFGDHLIARELLKKHLKTASARAVRRGFRTDNPLAQALTLEKDRHGFRPTSSLVGSGPAEALILEFPERVKNTPGISADERELLFYLPHWKEKYRAYRAPFLDGLYWRANTAFSRQTYNLMNSYLGNWQNLVTREPGRLSYSGEHSVIDALLSLACRHNSPVAACRLYRWVKSMSMPDRDVFWGSAVRDARFGGWIRNLFIWLSAIERNGFEKLSPLVTHNYVVLLSLFLGSTDRPLRDEATKALVVIGEKFPAALFSHTLDTLDFDDIYYPERMLAACYGVAMARWSDPEAKEFHNAFPEFAHAIVRNVFMPGGRLLTHHALVRDYALGIAEIARQLGVKFSKKQEAHMLPPFSAVLSPFPPASKIEEANLSDLSFALRMDFMNYTIGQLVPDRKNYDSSNPTYAEILRQIKWRMKDLGCAKDKFWERDKKISQESRWDSGYGKTDRYGKKYSWIAYYEMHGWLHAQGREMSEWQDPKRPVNGIIDPSFPVPSQRWDVKFKPLRMGGDDLHWLARGPSPDYGHILETDELGDTWVMLEGFTIHKNKDQSRELYSFLRGLLVREEDIPRLRKALWNSEHPGREPELDDGYYIFAGEIPWSPDFARTREDACEKKALDTVPVETVAFTYAWESHHSQENQFSGVYFPVPDICAKLHLSRRGRGVGLFDEHGRPASMYHADKSRLGRKTDSPQDEFQFLHLRKDLLDKYLHATGKRLVWMISGERRLFQHWIKSKPEPRKILAAYQSNLHVHKRLIVYPSNKK